MDEQTVKLERHDGLHLSRAGRLVAARASGGVQAERIGQRQIEVVEGLGVQSTAESPRRHHHA